MFSIAVIVIVTLIASAILLKHQYDNFAFNARVRRRIRNIHSR